MRNKFRDYNKMGNEMNDEDDGDVAVGGGDDAQSSKDLRSLEDSMPPCLSPSRSLPEVRFLRVLVSLDLRCLIHLHRARLFSEAE
jgi:hypothetical protein